MNTIRISFPDIPSYPEIHIEVDLSVFAGEIDEAVGDEIGWDAVNKMEDKLTEILRKGIRAEVIG